MIQPLGARPWPKVRRSGPSSYRPYSVKEGLTADAR
jgi:hypothetical protein